MKPRTYVDSNDGKTYVYLLEASYRRIHEERRIAQALLKAEVEYGEGTRRWAQEAFAEQRRLVERLEEVYDVAVRHGATREELAASVPSPPQAKK